MIRGKFYSGLPDKMMHREVRADRQQTNFFWPDESDAEDIPSRIKRRGSNAQTTATQKTSLTTANNESDIKPKELFQKQLSSCIEFYDNVDAKTPEARRRRFKNIDNVNLNNADTQFVPEKKKLEAFSSKIEFYDFADANGKPSDTKYNNMKHENDVVPPKKVIDSPESTKKRISFKSEPAKGILKNAGEMEEKKSQEPKSGLLPKHMSKSVDNMAKFAKSNETTEKPEKLSSIIREVKNMEISRNQRNQHYEEEDDYDYYQKGTRRPPLPAMNYYRDDERSYYRRDPRDYRYERRSPKYHDYEEDYNNRRYKRSPERNARTQSSFDDRKPKYEQDSFENHRTSHRYPQESRRRPQNDLDEQPIRKQRNDEREQQKISTPEKSSTNNSNDDFERKENSNQNYNSIETNGNSQRHLKSNISFTAVKSSQPNKPLSVRDSAVTRVGVGLPDI